MNRLTGSITQSSVSRIVIIAILVLVMLIPMAMTRGVIHDRQMVNRAALQDIMRSWGGRQLIGGPILVVPYKIVRVDPYGDRFEKDGDAFFLPENLSIDVGLVPEIRYRGIHEIPVFTAKTRISGEFPGQTNPASESRRRNSTGQPRISRCQYPMRGPFEIHRRCRSGKAGRTL